MRGRLAIICSFAPLGYLGLVWSCGGTETAEPQGDRVLASLEATAASPDDVIVARVDGHPVWGSCVAAQAAREHLTPQAARQRCIDFELLAQEAERRGFATAPEVIDGAREGLVNRFVETQYEQVFATPVTLRPQMARTVAKLMRRPDQPELRASSYLRVSLPEKATPEQDREAKVVADAMYAELAKLGDGRGLFSVDLAEAAARHKGDTKLEVFAADYHLEAITNLVDKYGDALFAIPAPGGISPVTRTEFGWETILLSDMRPPHVYTREEIEAELFPEARRQYFGVWVDQLAKAAHVEVVKHYDVLENMLVDRAAEDAAAPARPARPAQPTTPAPTRSGK